MTFRLLSRIPYPASRNDWLVVACVVLSGALMSIAFAPLELADAAWCSLVPLLIACNYLEPGRAWKAGWISGMVFWLLSIWWISRVTVIGCVLLCAYNSLYMIPFVLVSVWWFKRFGVNRFLLNAAFMFVITAVWTGSEYLRATLFTGFPWNPLGATQYANISFLQHASWGGVYILSALIVWANAAIGLTILRYLTKQARFGRKPHPELMLGMAVIVTAFLYGTNMVQAVDLSGRELRVALIQPSISQDEKWTPEKIDHIYDRLRTLTTDAAKLTKPDLIVWPETALPDDLMYSEDSFALVDELVRLGSPILVGSMDAKYRDGEYPLFFNSSFLIHTNSVLAGRYDKRHLVLFGEYVPLHEHIRFITAKTPISESFSPGSTSTVFRVPGKDIPFSSLICFEDSLAYLGRVSVKNGARMLVNQTNDAWFDPSAGSKQHMVLSIFRAVENRVPIIRSANTGYTCSINALGQIEKQLSGGDGDHSGYGFQLVTLNVPPDDMALSFYTRNGDIFAWACLPIGLIAVGFAWRKRRAAIERE